MPLIAGAALVTLGVFAYLEPAAMLRYEAPVQLVWDGLTQLAFSGAALMLGALLVVLALRLPTGRPLGVEDNGDGYRLYCGAGLRPDHRWLDVAARGAVPGGATASWRGPLTRLCCLSFCCLGGVPIRSP